jgi:hypothetical protein
LAKPAGRILTLVRRCLLTADEFVRVVADVASRGTVDALLLAVMRMRSRLFLSEQHCQGPRHGHEHGDPRRASPSLYGPL